MDPAITQPYEHLLKTLAAFAADTRASAPPGSRAERWTRAATHLEQELHRLRFFTTQANPNHEQLRQAATRLTQLARIQDGLRLEHSAAIPPDQLADQRRLVVFAAWQLQQALDHLSVFAGPR